MPGKKKGYQDPARRVIGKAANALAEKLPNAQKAAQRKMRTRKVYSSAARG